MHSVLKIQFKRDQWFWATQPKYNWTPVWFGVMFKKKKKKSCWAWQLTSWKMRKRRFFTRLRHREENFLHILQGGAGKQQLARDENKMLGDEEIRNTKELDLIKSRIKALFLDKMNWLKQEQWWRNLKGPQKSWSHLDNLWKWVLGLMYGLQHKDIMTGHFSFGFQREIAKCDNNVKGMWTFSGPQCASLFLYENQNTTDSYPDLQLYNFSRLFIHMGYTGER